MPRAPFKPTDEQRRLVRLARACGAGPSEIATALKIDTKTVNKYFAEELERAKIELVIRLGAKVIEKAMSGDNDMLKFYLRSHGGDAWKVRLEHTGAEGAPLVPPSLVLTVLGPDEPPAKA